MINTNDTVRIIYKDIPWEQYFWKTGEVTAVEDCGGTKVIRVKFPDGKVIGCTEVELERIRRRSNV